MPGWLFLTEAGDQIGLGHYMRCSAILDFVKKQGVDAEMILHLEGDFPDEKFSCKKDNWKKSFRLVKPFAERFDTVVVDSYLADESTIRDLKTHFNTVVCLDDNNRIQYPADLVINPNVYGHEMDYTKQNAECVGGSEFLILRSPFNELATLEPQIRSELRTLAVTVGGSDSHGLLPVIAECLSRRDWDSVIITGNDEMKDFLRRRFHHRKNLRFVGMVDSIELSAYFLASDTIICGGGQTLHEAAATGRPVLPMMLGADQERNLSFYKDLGFFDDWIDPSDVRACIACLQGLEALQDQKLRKIKVANGRSALGLNGIANIYEKVKHLAVTADLATS